MSNYNRFGKSSYYNDHGYGYSTWRKPSTVATSGATTAASASTEIKTGAYATQDVNKHEFPFHAPVIETSEWGYERVKKYNGNAMLSSVDYPSIQIEEVIKDLTIPVVFFPAKVWQEIRYLTNKYQKQEWAVFLILRKLDRTRPHFQAVGWWMPGQKATVATVNIPDTEYQKIVSYLVDTYDYFDSKNVHNYLLHLHSHHSMTLTGFSGTDDTQQLESGGMGFYGDYRFYSVVTTKSIKISFVYYNPVLQRINGAAGIMFGESEYVGDLTKERMAEIDKICDDMILQPDDMILKPHGAPSYGGAYGFGKYGYGYGKTTAGTAAKPAVASEAVNFAEGWDDDFGGYYSRTGQYGYGYDADGKWNTKSTAPAATAATSTTSSNSASNEPTTRADRQALILSLYLEAALNKLEADPPSGVLTKEEVEDLTDYPPRIHSTIERLWEYLVPDQTDDVAVCMAKGEINDMLYQMETLMTETGGIEELDEICEDYFSRKGDNLYFSKACAQVLLTCNWELERDAEVLISTVVSILESWRDCIQDYAVDAYASETN